MINAIICAQRFGQSGTGPAFRLTGREMTPTLTLTGVGSIAGTVKMQITAGFTGSDSEAWEDLDGSTIHLSGSDRVDAHFDSPIGGGSAVQNWGRFVVSGLAGSLKVSIASPDSRCSGWNNRQKPGVNQTGN